MSRKCYNKTNDDESYLYDKHKKYKLLKEDEKLDYSKTDMNSSINIQVETDSDNDN